MDKNQILIATLSGITAFLVMDNLRKRKSIKTLSSVCRMAGSGLDLAEEIVGELLAKIPDDEKEIITPKLMTKIEAFEIMRRNDMF